MITKIIDTILLITLIILVILARAEGYYNTTYVVHQDCNGEIKAIEQISEKKYNDFKKQMQTIKQPEWEIIEDISQETWTKNNLN